MNVRDLLNTIKRRLDSLLQTFPDHPIIPKALEHVDALRNDFNKDICVALADKLASLQAERAWNETGEDQRLLDELRLVSKGLNDQTNNIDIRIHLPTSKIPQIRHPDFPVELLDHINETYLLHTVAIHPLDVLPPGKSVLSVLSSRSRLDTSESDGSKSLKQQVSDMVFKAFWDEALEALSSPSAAIQLARLRLLYQDLHKAVETLVPPTIPIMYTLLYPLSPTSSPLRSASTHLKELLAVLRERCAPIRDEEFDRLTNRLEVSGEELPRACIDVVRGILQMSDLMKNDMADFIVGTWTEQDALNWLRRQAINKERASIIEMFTLPKVKELYETWLSEETEGEGRLVSRLIRALGSNQPVSPFPPSTNLLPPPLMYFAFDLFRMQNVLQALVISAALRTLVHRYLEENTNDWLGRIWTLLESETLELHSDTIDDGTRLINLEDEVISVSGLKDGEEQPLRDAVRRTIRVEDPAFKLLKKRLLDGIENRLSNPPSPSRVPDLLRSGKMNLPSLVKEPEVVGEDLIVKGFEEPVLRSNIREVALSLRRNLDWFNETWKGTLL